MAAERYGDSTSFFDKHTIFVTGLGPISTEQLNQALINFFHTCSQYFKTNRDHWGKWRINIATNREGKSIGVAYIFFAKSEAYHVILGKKPDGNRNYREIPNPRYKEEIDFSFDTLSDPGMSWADMSDEFEQPKTIREAIETPIVPFPPIKLTPNQKEEIGSEEITLQIKPCMTYNPEPEFDKYTLFAKNVPLWVDVPDLKALFKPFITTQHDLDKGFPRVSLVKQSVHHKNGFYPKTGDENDWRTQHPKREEKYKMVFVKFNSYGNDSMFALVMTKKVTIKGVGPNSDKSAELFFSYAKEQSQRFC